MRRFLVTLAVLSLAVRWADAGCGCAEHNGWVALAEHQEDGHGHNHGTPAEPALDHGCDGEYGRAVYAPGSRAQTTGVTLPAAAVVRPGLEAAPAGLIEGRFQAGPPSRSVLQVYRI